MNRKKLNIYSRATGELITSLTGAKPYQLLAKAAKDYGNECWEWDGWNRPAL